MPLSMRAFLKVLFLESTTARELQHGQAQRNWAPTTTVFASVVGVVAGCQLGLCRFGAALGWTHRRAVRSNVTCYSKRRSETF